MENNLKEIKEFINQWKERAIQYHFEELEEYKNIFNKRDELCKEHRRLEKINSDYWNNINSEEDYEKVKKELEENVKQLTEIENEQKKEYENIKSILKEKEFSNVILDSINYGKEVKNRIVKVIEREAEHKEKLLIARVNKAVGIIVKALNLNVGVNGELNGYIEGENGTCKIETIYAGGYNIQCLHYRVLVKVL